MPSPESFHPLPTELPAPPRERLRNSLIIDPYRSIQRAVEDIQEEVVAAFEQKVLTLSLNQHVEHVLVHIRDLMKENFNSLLGEISAECEQRLQDFNSKPDTVTPEQLETWFSGVVLKAAEVHETYLMRARRIGENAMMSLGQFKVAPEANLGETEESNSQNV